MLKRSFIAARSRWRRKCATASSSPSGKLKALRSTGMTKVREVHVRCSSCEPLLDRYVEGTLLPRTMAQVRTHVRDCDACRELLDELKAVDGLLFTTRVPELPQNFT